MVDLWFSEYHTEDVRFSIKVEPLWSEQTKFQRIDFFKNATFGTFFTLDGFIMMTEKDEFIYHEMICHPAFATNPEIQRVLIIGGGDGGTAREVARYPTVQQIDQVEIDERVVRLCQQYLPQTASVFTNEPRLKLHFVDGVEFIKNTPEGTYDLILVDSTDPIGPGEGLFTLEFYHNCYRALTADGILINQHESPYYPKDAREMKRAHQKIKATFPIARVYQFFMPTYPSGHWLFGFAAKTLDPVAAFKPKLWQQFNLKTRYYNPTLHTASFALPSYVQEMLSEDA
jgi:spermidine synthase